MKKVLSTLAVGLLAVSAMAQGTLVFNAGTSNIRNQSGTAMGAGAGQVQFAWAPTGTAFTPWTPALTAAEWYAANPQWSVIGVPVGTGVPAPGKFTGGTLTANTAAAGAVIQGVVIGWTGTGAQDFLAGYAAALAQGAAGQFGVSNPFQVDTGDPTSVPPGTAGAITGPTGFQGLTLQTIPEPTSFALAGLGAAALLIFRRRK